MNKESLRFSIGLSRVWITRKEKRQLCRHRYQLFCCEAAGVEQSGDRFRVESYAVEPLPPNSVVEKNINDAEVVGEVVRKVVSKSKAGSKLAAVAVADLQLLPKQSKWCRPQRHGDGESNLC